MKNLKNAHYKTLGGDGALGTALKSPKFFFTLDIIRKDANKEDGADNDMNNKLKEEQQRKIKEQEENDPDKHLRPITEFMDDDGNVVVDEEELPYASIELLINNRNVFANMKNHDPSKIFYHIHKTYHLSSF